MLESPSVNQGAIPENLSAAAGEGLLLELHAEGAQVYVCETGPDAKKSWVLKKPEAILSDDRGSEIGSHFAGPTWQHKDGSQIRGRPHRTQSHGCFSRSQRGPEAESSGTPPQFSA